MALFENFPYTNLHELNLDWLIEELKKVKDASVISVNGQTGEVILYENPTVYLPEVNVNQWEIIRSLNGDTVGIYFKKDGSAYITKESTLDKIYTENNPPTYPVTSVNGQTGDVILFSEQYIQLPTLTDQQLTNWNIYRTVNNILSGIEFDGSGNAYVMNGSSRYKIWDNHNSPNWENREVTLPTITGANETWSMTRIVNGTEVGIAVDKSGWAWIVHGNELLPIYTNGFNEPSDFNVPTNAVLEIKENLTTGTRWGIVREVNSQIAGIVFIKNNNTGLYEAYTTSDNGTTVQKLLTTSDIPSSTGVISINGMSGVVSLDGTQINITSNDALNIKQYIDQADNTLRNSISYKADEQDVAYVQNSPTATRSYKKDEYLFYMGSIARALVDINSGTTIIPDTHIEILTKGVSNDILENYFSVNEIAGGFTFNTTSVDTSNTNTTYTIQQYGKLRILRIGAYMIDNNTGYVNIGTVLAGHRPAYNINSIATQLGSNADKRMVQLRTTGELRMNGGNASSSASTSYAIYIVYLVP